MTATTQAADLTLVVGATGKTGRRVADRLLASGVPVRLGSRSATPRFDWEEPSTWPAALAGTAAAYGACYADSAVPGAPEAIAAFAERALEAGTRRIVLLSGRGEEEAQRAEEALRSSGAESDDRPLLVVHAELQRKLLPRPGARRRGRAPRGRGRRAVRRPRRHRRSRRRGAH